MHWPLILCLLAFVAAAAFVIGRMVGSPQYTQISEESTTMQTLPLNISVGDNVLITTDAWFYAPDGKSYRAVFGKLKSVRTAEDTLGIKPNGRSTNWYVEVGNMLIAGCQVHYAVKSDRCNSESVETHHVHDGKNVVSMRPSEVYMAGDA